MPLIENLQITNFKCFKQLDVQGLGQVNLIGGKNNVGKTAFLEAVELFALSEEPYDLASSMYKILERRQDKGDLTNPLEHPEMDFIYGNESETTFVSPLKICKIKYGIHFSEAGIPFQLLTACVNDEIRNFSIKENEIIFLTNRNQRIFISSSKVREQEIAILLGSLIDLGREEFLDHSLSLFDNNLLQLKLIPIERGILLKIKLKDRKNLVLLSSLGEGVNRYIAIVCAIWANKDGFLLIDEIENGIHYTNYKKLWEIIFKVSVDANCQLFITTHSKESITAFNDMQFENESCNAQYFELYKNLKTDLIIASSRDKEQLRYALTHEGRIRGE